MVRPLALKRQPAHFSINVFWAGQTFYYNFTLRLRRSSQAVRRGFVGRIFGDNDSLRILLEQLSETFKASLFGKRRWLSINKFFRAMFCLLRSISFAAGGKPRSTNNMPSYGAVVTALFALETKGRVVEELSPRAHPVSIESGCALSSRVGACPVRKTGIHPGSSPGQAFSGTCARPPGLMLRAAALPRRSHRVSADDGLVGVKSRSGDARPGWSDPDNGHSCYLTCQLVLCRRLTSRQFVVNKPATDYVPKKRL